MKHKPKVICLFLVERPIYGVFFGAEWWELGIGKGVNLYFFLYFNCCSMIDDCFQ